MPRILLAAGAALLLVAGILAVVFHRHNEEPVRTVTVPPPAQTTTAAATTTTTAAPPPVAMSWDAAGGLVVHPGDIDPAQLGTEMRDAGFGWIAVDLAHFDAGWADRFRASSGLPVGGWSVLGDDPRADAASAAQAVQADALAFYIADAESPYGYTQGDTHSSASFARSREFAMAFRAAQPHLPAAVSSYCRADQHDIDWSAWANAGFEFLPQAYVNDFGARVSPALCARGAARWFPVAHVHPTIGSYSGLRGIVPPARWIALLRSAGTTGFSIYPAEVGMSPEAWQAYGAVAGELARRP